jgi:hypothetical protein
MVGIATCRRRAHGTRRLVLARIVLGLAVALAPSPAGAKVYDIVENDTLDFDFSTRKGLRFEWREPEVRLRLGGRLHTDAVVTDEDRTNLQAFDADLRRARLYLDGRVLEDFRFKVDR